MNARSLPTLLAALGLALAACGSPADPGEDEVPMPIERVDVLIMESLPVQVAVQVRGYLPDSCWSYAGGSVGRNGNTFTIRALMERNAPRSAVCLQRIENVERTFTLGPLPPGDYTAVVNGTSYSFRVS